MSTNLVWTLPATDGTAGQALVTDASGTLSFAAAGATITSDTSTDTDFLLYFASTTSGALTPVKQDSGLVYNPNSGTLTSAEFVGGGVGLTGLSGTAITSGTVAAARVATLNQNTTGSAATLTTARAIQVSGAVTGTADFDGSAAINIVTTATSDPTITLSGAVTGSGTLTNLGDVTITTTATADPTLTLAGDLSGSATFTNLGNATLTATIAANSVALGTDTTGNYVAAGATSGSGISGSVSSEGGTFTVTSNATNANTGSTIVFRDGSGNFSAGTITANLTGNASGSSGSCTGNSATATTATNVTVSANNTANETVYLTFVDGATGTQGLETDTGLSYNPSTNVLATTASQAQYADLAERYEAEAPVEPGTVVHFGGSKEIKECDEDGCSKVAGIISTTPAYMMNADAGDDSTHPYVALKGRVPCKVQGSIKKGDMMVSAGNGRARAEADPKMGSVIGKAIADSEGEAVIEVVVL